MALRLEYPDKYRLWADLIQGNTDRVFVATDEPQKISARVPVELSLPELSSHVIITGQIVGTRRKSERFCAGAFVRFPDEGIEKCRRFLGLSQSPERYESGRKARRVACAYGVKFKRPEVPDHCNASNISETGLLVYSPVELQVGQYVEFDLMLDEGAALPMRAEVSRGGSGSRLVGLRFLEVPPECAERIAGSIARAVKAAPEVTPCIVVADDDPLILDFLAKALSRFGYQIQKARRGEEALSLVREAKPKLVVLDILMPGIDGVDICKMMRADVEMADIPVIFLSALDPSRLHAVADESGATDYLVKPVALADLLNVVGAYLKG
ncbi:MAG: response regulator [Myxococcaceae bacterium]